MCNLTWGLVWEGRCRGDDSVTVSCPKHQPRHRKPRMQQRTQSHNEEAQIYCPESHYMFLTTTVMPSFSRGVLS